MTTFIQPNFWAVSSRARVASHAISVLVQPAAVVVSASLASPTVITTATAHYYVTGDTVTLAGIAGAAPSTVNGSWIVTVLTATTFTIPLPVTVAGTGGTATRTVPVEPLTLAEGKLRAGLDWSAGDARDALMTGFIQTARSTVEQDTGLALLSQVRDVYYDAVASSVLQLPAWSLPLQSVVSVKSTDTSDVVNTLATTQYVVDLASARVGLALSGSWPSDLRPFQPFVVRIVAGWTSVALIPAPLVHAVGLLAAHYATAGRDLTTVGSMTSTPYGYDCAIAPYQAVCLA